jgi:hypothetical protein
MARKKPTATPQSAAIREPAVTYDARQPVTEVFWLAFQSLTKEQKLQFLGHLLDDPEFYEEMADAVAMIEGRGEPTRPYEEFAAELRREGRL